MILLICPFRITFYSAKSCRGLSKAPQLPIYLFHNSWPISACVRTLTKTPVYQVVGVIDHWLQHHTDMPSLKTPKVLPHAGFLLHLFDRLRQPIIEPFLFTSHSVVLSKGRLATDPLQPSLLGVALVSAHQTFYNDKFKKKQAVAAHLLLRTWE